MMVERMFIPLKKMDKRAGAKRWGPKSGQIFKNNLLGYNASTL
jgi:hypothetical protein